MAKKKRGGKTLRREQRLQKARQWLPTYEGQKIVRAYRKKFHVDVSCAVRDLQALGYPFAPGYVDNLLKSEAIRQEQNRRRKEQAAYEEQYNEDQDDMFYYIAGYTSGGAPYGVTWEEMGLEPYEEEFEYEDIVEYRYYELLHHRARTAIDDELRDSFSAYVERNRRLPSKHDLKALIEPIFKKAPGGPLYYDKDFHKTFRKLVRKRENAFIRKGILPKRFSPTEKNSWLARSEMLESERLIFRKITDDDFEDLAIMLRDPEVMYAWEHTFSDEQIQAWINTQATRYRDHIVGYFALISKETGEFIGQAGLFWSDIDQLRALEIGYMLKREYWGQGYATESASALAQFAFEEIGLNKVYATIRPENTSSIRVAERIGMTLEGTYIKQYNGIDMKHNIYSLCRADENEPPANPTSPSPTHP